MAVAPAGYVANIERIVSAVRLYRNPLHPSDCGFTLARNAEDTPTFCTEVDPDDSC